VKIVRARDFIKLRLDRHSWINGTPVFALPNECWQYATLPHVRNFSYDYLQAETALDGLIEGILAILKCVHRSDKSVIDKQAPCGG
jgi:hypothetical protein